MLSVPVLILVLLVSSFSCNTDMDGHISVGTAGLITDRLEKRITAHSNFLLSVIIASANYVFRYMIEWHERQVFFKQNKALQLPYCSFYCLLCHMPCATSGYNMCQCHI